MIHPHGTLRSTWDQLVIGTAIAAAIWLPLAVVFGHTPRLVFLLCSLAITAVFAVDVYLTFRTSYVEGGKLIDDLGLIGRRYLRGWFTVDLLALIPTGAVVAIASDNPSTALRAIGLLPLIKLAGISRFISRITSPRINPALLRLGLLVSWIMMAAHLIASGWMLIVGNPDGLPAIDRYVSAFYWTITTITTIGYGDITPTGPGQTLFVIIIEILGQKTHIGVFIHGATDAHTEQLVEAARKSLQCRGFGRPFGNRR